MNRWVTVSLGVALAACTGAAMAQRPGFERGRDEGRAEVRSDRGSERGEARVRGEQPRGQGYGGDQARSQQRSQPAVADSSRGQGYRGEQSRGQGYRGEQSRGQDYAVGQARGQASRGNDNRRTEVYGGRSGGFSADVASGHQRQAYNYNAPRAGLPSAFGGNAVPRSSGYRDQGGDRYGSNRGRGGDRDDRWDRHRDDRRGNDRWDRHGDDRRWDRSYSDRRDHRSWRDHNWRRSWSHGWSGHRYRAPSRYYHPRGYSSRSWRIGWSVPLVYLAASYFVDYRPYGLAPPPYGCSWIRIDGDVLLVDNLSGEVVDILYGFYY